MAFFKILKSVEGAADGNGATTRVYKKGEVVEVDLRRDRSLVWLDDVMRAFVAAGEDEGGPYAEETSAPSRAKAQAKPDLPRPDLA